MSNHNVPQPPKGPIPLMKQHSLPSPETSRYEAWLRKKKKRPLDLRRTKSVTNDDLEELQGCIDLGFSFEPDHSPELNQRLNATIPALDLYYTVHRQSSNHLSRTSSFASEREVGNSSTMTIVDKGDDLKTMKQKMKQWAKMVALSVKQLPGKPN